MQKKISIVIPARNKAKELGFVLASLGRQNMHPSQFEIIVVNDASTDDTESVVQLFALANQTISVVIHSSPGGSAARARNVGLRQAGAEIVVFLDADVVVPPDFLTTHYESHCGSPKTVVLGRVFGQESVPFEIKHRFPMYFKPGQEEPGKLLENLGTALKFRAGRRTSALLRNWNRNRPFIAQASR